MLVKTCNQIVQAIPFNLSKQAGERKIIPVNSDFKFLRFKAIGNLEVDSANGNHDGFPYEGFEMSKSGFGYKSFIGKLAHFEHNSSDGIRGSIGDIPDSFLNKFTYLEDHPAKRWEELKGKENYPVRDKILNLPNQKDGSIEVLMRIDTTLLKKTSTLKSNVKQALERIVRAIDTGQRLNCSMGANIAYSDCSACGQRVYFAKDYCNHLKHRKGGITIVSSNEYRDLMDKDVIRPEWLKHLCVSKYDVDELIKGASNKSVAVRNFEINYEPSFFELSIVAVHAYAKGVMLEKLASRQIDETKKEWLLRIGKELGNDGLIDLYDVLKNEGLIANSCMVN